MAGKGRPPLRRASETKGRVILEGATGRNLREVRLDVPLGGLTVVSGVSGAGKSTLVLDTLAPALRQKLTGKGTPLPFASLSIEGELHEVSVVEPGGEWVRSPRSTVATLSGMLDDLRSLFASLPDAKLQGWTATRFSPNVRGGRCEVCDGIGEEKVELHLLPDAWMPCPRCQGARFDSQTLSVRWKGLSIADVLALDLEQAKTLFVNHPKLGSLTKRLCDAGLGHLSGGRRSDSLSGGEALRLRLASRVGGNSRKRDAVDPGRADARIASAGHAPSGRGLRRTGRDGRHGRGHFPRSGPDVPMRPGGRAGTRSGCGGWAAFVRG